MNKIRILALVIITQALPASGSASAAASAGAGSEARAKSAGFSALFPETLRAFDIILRQAMNGADPEYIQEIALLLLPRLSITTALKNIGDSILVVQSNILSTQTELQNLYSKDIKTNNESLTWLEEKIARYVQSRKTLERLLQLFRSEKIDIKKMQSEAFAFRPDTEVITLEDEKGNFRIVSAKPQRLYEKIVEEESKLNLDQKKADQNIQTIIDALRSSYPGFNVYFTVQEQVAQYKQKKEVEREKARKLVIAKWAKELDQDINLLAKVDILSRLVFVVLKPSILNSESMRLLWKKIEDVKKDFALEIHHEELNESEEEEIRLILKQVILQTMHPLLGNTINGKTGLAFADQWVDAVEQKERDSAIEGFTNTITDQLEACIMQQNIYSQEDQLGLKIKEEEEEQLIRSKAIIFLHFMNFLQNYISEETYNKAIDQLKEYDLFSGEGADRFMQEGNDFAHLHDNQADRKSDDEKE